MTYSTEERNEWRIQHFRKTEKPAESAFQIISKEHLQDFALTCRHPELVESFLKILESNQYVQHRWTGNNQYGLLTDENWWITFDRQVTAGDWTLDRTAKLFLELKGGGYGFHVWGHWLEGLRMHLVGAQILESDKDKGYLKAVVVFKSGDPFILTVCRQEKEFAKKRTTAPVSKSFIEEPDDVVDALS